MWSLDSFHEFPSSWVALYLNKSTIRPLQGILFHVWAGGSSCYLDIWDKRQAWVCRTVCPSLAASVEPLAHCGTAQTL